MSSLPPAIPHNPVAGSFQPLGGRLDVGAADNDEVLAAIDLTAETVILIGLLAVEVLGRSVGSARRRKQRKRYSCKEKC